MTPDWEGRKEGGREGGTWRVRVKIKIHDTG
jgi:hypothetical protein